MKSSRYVPRSFLCSILLVITFIRPLTGIMFSTLLVFALWCTFVGYYVNKRQTPGVACEVKPPLGSFWVYTVIPDNGRFFCLMHIVFQETWQQHGQNWQLFEEKQKIIMRIFFFLFCFYLFNNIHKRLLYEKQKIMRKKILVFFFFFSFI